MTNKVRVGIVGIRGWAEGIHMNYIQANPRAELVAVCGHDPQRTAEVARKHGIPQIFTDYHQMIAQAGLDAIIVCAPDDLHYPITMAALDQRLHILCEKPLALNLEQAREIRDRAVSAGVIHMSFFTFRWVPFYLKIKHLLEEGYIGRCLSCEFHNLEGNPDNRYMWQIDRQRSNGVLGDRGVHTIDMARWLVGDIARVNARLATYKDWQAPAGQALDAANDDALLMVEFASGAQGMIHVSYVSYQADHGHTQRVFLYGDKGTLVGELPIFGSTSSGTVLRGARYGEGPFQDLPIADDPAQEAFYHQHVLAYGYDVFGREMVGDNLFIDSILANRPASPDFNDGFKAQEVIEAAELSHQQGCWVSV